MIDVEKENESWNNSFEYITKYDPSTDWLGDGKTSEKIINILKEKL
jgi:hypothetical protein